MTMWCSAVGGIFTLLLGLLATPGAVEAQPAQHIPRLGFLSGGSPAANAARVQTFRQGLRELGYVEGHNLVIEWRYAEGQLERLPALAAELVRLKVDVIVTAAPGPTRAAKAATATMPIVMAYDSDPVGNGFVASLAHPGGNITGLSSLAPEISGKQFELLRALVPRLSRVVVLGMFDPLYASRLHEIEHAAGALQVHLQYLNVRGLEDMARTFQEARAGRADAVVVLASPILESHRSEVAALAAQYRLPTIYHVAEFVEAGGLMSYGASFLDLYRRAATYVDKILKGAKPADLPVEQPTKFELVINLKTAKALDLPIPPILLLQADKVIE
jgi:putative ABC transport system substrate-binding protein